MAQGPLEFMLEDLKSKFEAHQVSSAFTRLYDDQDFRQMFAVLHMLLNKHFEAINGRAKTSRHYWAEPSRELIALIDNMDQDFADLKAAGIEIALDDRYRQAIERCVPWLVMGGGSTVPEDFEPISLIKHEPVFSRPTTTKLRKRDSQPPLKMEGEGSYAIVYSYIDPDYNKKFAIKRAKPNISGRDLLRFKQEFEIMKRLSFPYVVEVYSYEEDKNQYRMEFCDATLRNYIARRNGDQSFSFSSRKRIALQFLYGIHYIHTQSLWHRDLSLQNVLLKVYTSGAVLVKLSDFGLAKDRSSTFTRTQTEMRGTIRDPLLDSFKEYGEANEIYSVGWILSYIFTGRDSLKSTDDAVSRIVQKCTANEASKRYATVRQVIEVVERLGASPTDATA